MKNRKVLAFCLILVSFIFSGKVFSQCTYTLVNALSTGCDALVDVYIWYPSNCPGTPATACQYIQNQLVPAGQQVPIPCGTCPAGTPCEIEVIVTDIGGNSISPPQSRSFTNSTAISVNAGACGTTVQFEYISASSIFKFY